MNTFIKIIGILTIGSALAQAEEYKTLVRMGTPVTPVVVDVLPTDLVEIVGGRTNPYGQPLSYSFQFENDIWSDSDYYMDNTSKGNKITSIKAIKLLGTGWITIKITHTEELSKVGPTSVLVLPENSTGNYDVVVESSGDMTTWSPFVSQTVQSDAAKNFFRVRIVKK